MPPVPYPPLRGTFSLKGKAYDTRKTYDQQTFGHRPIYIRGESATDLPSPLGKGDRVSGG